MILAGKVALVTGGGRGIGRAMARALGVSGARVAVASRTSRDSDETRAALEAEGIEVLARASDVVKPEDVKALVAAIEARWGRVDVLVNSAGVVGAIGRLDECDAGEWHRAFEVNVFGTMHACAAVLPGMRSRRSGKIVNLAGGGVGGAGVLGRWSAYIASKAAVVQLTEALAREVADDNVQVNAIAPGAIVTEMTAGVVAAGPEKAGKELYERTLKERQSGGESPERAAKLVVWLASGASGALTGKMLSAKWDKVEGIDAAAANASSLYCLRRIDNDLFAPVARKVKVGIVGCGLIGGKRAAALGKDDALVATFDLVPERARALASKHKTEASASLDELVAKSDAVIVATTNDQLTPVSLAAARAGKHVVVEKPAARSVAELEPLAALAREKRLVVKVGYNHRFHPAAQKAHEILSSGAWGDVMFIRGRYGHGGRVGYDKEWRADPTKSGGGELIDQGVHLIDLARWYLGADFVDVSGRAETYFWDMPVDDNAFLTLGTAKKQVAHLQVSCTEWKNMFSLEIYARHAKLHWEGLGGSYGPERLYHYMMKPEMGPPDAVIYEYAPFDGSWTAEWSDFKRAVQTQTRATGDVDDALEVLRVVERIVPANAP